jgi:hypothetical protein
VNGDCHMSYGGVCLNCNRKAIFSDVGSEPSEPVIGQNILSIQLTVN